MGAIEVRQRVVEVAVLDVEGGARRRLVVPRAHHRERRVVGARVLRARQRVSDEIAEPVGKAPLEFQLHRVIPRVILGVDHVDATKELRVGEEEIRPETRRDCHLRAIRLGAGAEGAGKRCHGVEGEVRGKQPPDHGRAALTDTTIRVRLEQLIHQGAFSSRLHDVVGVQEPVVEDLRLVDVVSAKEVFRPPADVGDLEQRLREELFLVGDRPAVRDGCLELRIDHPDVAAADRSRLQEVFGGDRRLQARETLPQPPTRQAECRVRH